MRWLVVRRPLGRRFAWGLNDGWHLDVGSQRLGAIGPGEVRCLRRWAGIRTSPIKVRGVSGSNMEPRATRTSAREMRVGLNVAWTSKTPRTARPSWSGASGPSYAMERRHGPRVVRWRRGRVGRAVIRDVAIRAAPVRCPHKCAPSHAPTLSPNTPHNPSVVATSRSAGHPTTPRTTRPGSGPCEVARRSKPMWL
jgi:hypothetical protein